MTAIKITVFSLVLSFLIFAFGVFSSNGLNKSRHLRQKIDQSQIINLDLQHQKTKLEDELRLLQSSTYNPYIEKVIREELGYLKQNEAIMIFPTQ